MQPVAAAAAPRQRTGRIAAPGPALERGDDLGPPVALRRGLRRCRTTRRCSRPARRRRLPSCRGRLSTGRWRRLAARRLPRLPARRRRGRAAGRRGRATARRGQRRWLWRRRQRFAGRGAAARRQRGQHDQPDPSHAATLHQATLQWRARRVLPARAPHHGFDSSRRARFNASRTRPPRPLARRR